MLQDIGGTLMLGILYMQKELRNNCRAIMFLEVALKEYV